MEETSTISQEIQSIKKQVNNLCDYKQGQLKKEWEQQNQREVPKLIAQLDALQATNTHDKGLIMYLSGKLLNLKEEYDEKVETLLKQSVEFIPNKVDAWLTLADVQWKKQDYSASKNSIDKAIQVSKEPNKLALQKLSMVLRKLGNTEGEVLKNTIEAVQKAKDAVALDVTDGDSWYVLGNGQLALYFTAANSNDLKPLYMTLAAFKQAEKYLRGINKMDMCYNRSSIHRYLEDYQSAINDLKMALTMDPEWESAILALHSIIDHLSKIKLTMNKPGKFKSKKLEQLINNSTKNGDSVVNLNQLHIGENEGKVVHGFIIKLIPNPARIPVTIVIMDSQENCIGVSIYNILVQSLEVGQVITIPNPKVKQIKILSDMISVEYNTISVEIPTNLRINGVSIKPEHMPKTSITITQK